MGIPRAKSARLSSAGVVPPDPYHVTTRRRITTGRRKPRSTAGVAEAKAAAKMTSEKWRRLQVGMAEKWPAPEYMSIPMPGRSHTNYRDETYEIVTRWTADTKIAYRPHAKSPGSKSHLRYEKYARAKTVGQALKLGSWPSDWCWDYERGFIKVFGPVREEPIDITQHTDGAKLTAVDHAIYRWYNKELAKKLGVNYLDLFGTTDPSILRAHRLVAVREAKARLEAAAKQRRSIRDEDVEAVLRAWAFVKNSQRGNVIPEGGTWVWSDTVGLVRDRNGSIHLTPPTHYYPEVVQLLVRWLMDRLPQEAKNFKFTSLNLNYNYAARRHRDGNNFGPSFIKAFGDFKGGSLHYWPEDNKQKDDLDHLPVDKAMRFDIGPGEKGGLALFNGNSAHAVEQFEGDRFSVVYFTLGCHDRATDEDVAYMRSLGVPFPAKEEDPEALLRAPLGYNGRARAAGQAAAARPTSMFWRNSQLKERRRQNSAKDQGKVKKAVLKRPAGKAR